jgi:hypothetical protein
LRPEAGFCIQINGSIPDITGTFFARGTHT